MVVRGVAACSFSSARPLAMAVTWTWGKFGDGGGGGHALRLDASHAPPGGQGPGTYLGGLADLTDGPFETRSVSFRRRNATFVSATRCSGMHAWGHSTCAPPIWRYTRPGGVLLKKEPRLDFSIDQSFTRVGRTVLPPQWHMRMHDGTKTMDKKGPTPTFTLES